MQWVELHWELIAGIALYILSAARSTMPKPGAAFNLYAWFYDFSGVVLNHVERPFLPAQDALAQPQQLQQPKEE